MGNTCYMNAILQALLGIPSFKDDVLSDEYTNAGVLRSMPILR